MRLTSYTNFAMHAGYLETVRGRRQLMDRIAPLEIPRSETAAT